MYATNPIRQPSNSSIAKSNNTKKKQLNHQPGNAPTATTLPTFIFSQCASRPFTPHMLSSINTRPRQVEELENLTIWMEENHEKLRGKPADWINRVKEEIFSTIEQICKNPKALLVRESTTKLRSGYGPFDWKPACRSPERLRILCRVRGPMC